MRWHSIKLKIIAVIVGIGLIVAFFFGIFSSFRSESLGVQITQNNAAFVTRLLAENLALGMQTMILDDGEAVKATVEALEIDPNDPLPTISAVAIYDTELNFVAGANTSEEPARPEWQVEETVLQEEPDTVIALTPMMDSDGSSLGIVRIVFSKAYLQQQVTANSWATFYVSILVVMFTALIGLLLARMITTPLQEIVEISQAIAMKGDLGRDPTIHRRDEMGTLADAFRELIAYIRDMAQSADRLSSGELGVQINPRSQADELSRSFARMTDTLKDMFKRLSQQSEQLNENADGLSDIAQSMGDQAQQLKTRAVTVNDSSNEMSTNMEFISQGMANMDQTISTIADNTQSAGEATQNAVTATQTAIEHLNHLREAAGEISEITDFISEVSAQTKLLSLNATIEAARAGESGKGFAVVANEVKLLVRKIDEAAEKIRDRIEATQSSTRDVSNGIASINQVITQVDQLVLDISNSLQEQSATTRQSAESIRNAATSAKVIASELKLIKESSLNVTSAAEEVKSSSTTLTNMGEQLGKILSQFRI
jgi:methyl-accepting chemotaxis protein